MKLEFTDGTKLSGEAEITAAGKNIKHILVSETDPANGEPKAVQEVIELMLELDVVGLGPGSLSTSICSNLMIGNLGELVKKTKAEVIYIVNMLTQKGETQNFTELDVVAVLNEQMGENFVDTVLVYIEPVPDNYLDVQKYNEILTPVKHNYVGLRDMGCRVFLEDFLKRCDRGVSVDGDKVAKEILNLAF